MIGGEVKGRAIPNMKRRRSYGNAHLTQGLKRLNDATSAFAAIENNRPPFEP
jgi:hypothetical protein